MSLKAIRKIVRKKLVNPLQQFLKQGMTPHKLALGITLGMAIGLIPIIGITTILCFILSIPLRINMGVIQVVNYFIYPLQILLIIPLIELGSFILAVPAIPYSPGDMIHLIHTNFSLAVNKLWMATLAGSFAWLILILPLSMVSYFVLKRLFDKIIKHQDNPGPVRSFY